MRGEEGGGGLSSISEMSRRCTTTRSACTGGGDALVSLEEGRCTAAVLHCLDVRRRADLGGDVASQSGRNRDGRKLFQTMEEVRKK